MYPSLLVQSHEVSPLHARESQRIRRTHTYTLAAHRERVDDKLPVSAAICRSRERGVSARHADTWLRYAGHRSVGHGDATGAVAYLHHDGAQATGERKPGCQLAGVAVAHRGEHRAIVFQAVQAVERENAGDIVERCGDAGA